MVLRATDELNDFCAHENPSHTAIATRPANASEIKYAVMPGLARSESICGMTVSRDHFRREPYLRKRGRVRARTMSTPRAGAFARTGNVNKSSDGSAA